MAIRSPTSRAATAKTSPAKKAAAKTTPAKKAAVKKAGAKAAPAGKAAVKAAPAKKAPAKSAPAKAAPAKAAPAKKAPAKTAAPRAGGKARSRGLEPAVAATPAALPADFFSAFTGDVLSDADFALAAQALACEAAAIRAVAEVETRGAAFDSSNRPTILYERHLFSRSTVPPGKFNGSHPDLSATAPYPKGGYGTMAEQYPKLARAFQLDPEAALKAPSWGKFQILGLNHKACGHATVTSFVKAMTVSEREHLRAFVNFVAANPAMLQALRKKDWAAFALRYNGPEFAKFQYDKKMAAAYAKFA